MEPERGPNGRWNHVLLAATLAGSVLTALFGRAFPKPLPPDAPPEVFSAGRAMRILAEIARRPRPVGSLQHEFVEIRLLDEMQRAGLSPERHEAQLLDHELTNLYARLPGLASTGTVLLTAHHDSRPTTPGAGDDGIGVVSWLEALRALNARGWQPRNDVVLLLTDGEELGLLGAQAFAKEHPLAADVRTVVNLEAIGNGGPAVLFELGPENGPRVRAFASVVAAPTGTSLADAVYRDMPNDTDLSVFLRSGIGGFNLAITSGSSAYHAPHDTPENLDPRSVQHMGECALALAGFLGDADLTRLTGPDVTFFDLLGRVLVVYPRWVDWIALGLGLALTALALRRAPPRSVSRATSMLLVDVTGMAALVALLWWGLDRLLGLFGPTLDWVPGNTTTATLALLGILALVTGRALRRARDRDAPDAGMTGSALGLLATLAVLSTWKLPGAAFALVWPLVLLAGAQAIGPGIGAGAALTLSLAATVLMGLPIVHLLLQLFERTPASSLALTTAVLAFFAAACGPHAWTLARGPRSTGPWLVRGGLALLILAVGIARLGNLRQGAFWP